jgi:hypothetical protein
MICMGLWEKARLAKMKHRYRAVNPAWLEAMDADIFLAPGGDTAPP